MTRFIDYAIPPAFVLCTILATQGLLHTSVAPGLVTLLVLLPVAVVAAILERIRPERDDYIPLDQPLGVELAHFLFNYHLGYFAAMAACAGVAEWARECGSLWPQSWPLAAQVLLAAFIGEGVSYWQHRLYHRVPWLWRFHALHHHGSRLNLLRAGRFHGVDIGPATFMVLAPLIILRAPEAILVWTATLSGMFGILQHANIRMRTLPLLDRLICTPAVHRSHHAADVDQSNANFGTLVMVFDWIFGTYRCPPAPVQRPWESLTTPLPRASGGSFWALSRAKNEQPRRNLLPLPSELPGHPLPTARSLGSGDIAETAAR